MDATTSSTYQVVTWYDRSERAWITYVQDDAGTQVGDAMVDGTKADRDASVRYLQGRVDRGEYSAD